MIKKNGNGWEIDFNQLLKLLAIIGSVIVFYFVTQNSTNNKIDSLERTILKEIRQISGTSERYDERISRNEKDIEDTKRDLKQVKSEFHKHQIDSKQ